MKSTYGYISKIAAKAAKRHGVKQEPFILYVQMFCAEVYREHIIEKTGERKNLNHYLAEKVLTHGMTWHRKLGEK